MTTAQLILGSLVLWAACAVVPIIEEAIKWI